MDRSQSSGTPPHPPPKRTETRTCPDCGGEGYVPIDHLYDPATGSLTILGGLCYCCRGEGEVTVYLYGVAGAGS